MTYLQPVAQVGDVVTWRLKVKRANVISPGDLMVAELPPNYPPLYGVALAAADEAAFTGWILPQDEAGG